MAGVVDPRRLVFVDECGAHTSLAPVYGYSPKGEPLKLSVPPNRGPNTTLLASITLKGMGPSMAVSGSSTAEVFDAYLKRFLIPELEEGQVVVMDRVPSHKPRRVRELIEGWGCELCCTCLAISPDYNPIEEAFSKIKEILRRAATRTREALVEAMGRALSAVSSRDARGFFEHAGYHSTGQLP